MSLCLLNIKSYMEPHPTTNRQSYFKHYILSESNKNCKILQNSQKKGIHEVSGHFDTTGITSILQRLSRSSRRRQCWRHQIFDQSLWMVSKYLQKAPRQISSQTDTVWPSINPRKAKSSLSVARTSDAATHQTKHMSSFYMLPKGCTSNSGHSDNIWPSFDAPKQNPAYRRRSYLGPLHLNRS